MKRSGIVTSVVLSIAAVSAMATQGARWTPVPVADDPLVRMPGTQPNQGVNLESPQRCFNCHSDYDPSCDPGAHWQGSMMAQASRDFLFWACLTVAAQDSIWAVGTPNAVDLCERCHFPEGWLEGRSDPPNVSLMTGSDYDGVHCDFCHQMIDPFFVTTHDGTREGNDWSGYWDEASVASQLAADETRVADAAVAATITHFNGAPFYGTDEEPVSDTYTENGAGQFFVSAASDKRASFADAAARHKMLYSRYHKSRYFCGTCHDVSNPVLANLGQDGSSPLTTETESAFSYMDVERTFSEFMLSEYGLPGGAPGTGPFAPDVFETSTADDWVSRCQDCHMRDVIGAGADKAGVPVRPTESSEHPESGQPLHDLAGGNVWVTTVLASAVPGSPNHDPVNEQLLGQGPGVLTLDLTQGLGLDSAALLDGADRAHEQLSLAASIEDLEFDEGEHELSFKIRNHTGHKLLSGFPEGRRIFVNVKAYAGDLLVREINPYDATVGTLKGLPADYSPHSPPLAAHEEHEDELVYECHPESSLTGESQTFHFALADGRHKDNRIPPRGFRIGEAAARRCEPMEHGAVALDLFTPEEYAGGYDEVELDLPATTTRVEVALFYQVTSREYVEFLRDEINGTAATLSSPTPSGEAQAYVAQTDPFFSALAAWGDTIWQLWEHNRDVPGAAPVLMAFEELSLGGYLGEIPIRRVPKGSPPPPNPR